MEIYKAMIEHAPFLATATGHAKMNTTRILEALIIAAIATWGSSYVTTEKLKANFENMKIEVSEIKRTVDRLHPRHGDRRFPVVPD